METYEPAAVTGMGDGCYTTLKGPISSSPGDCDVVAEVCGDDITGDDVDRFGDDGCCTCEICDGECVAATGRTLDVGDVCSACDCDCDVVAEDCGDDFTSDDVDRFSDDGGCD